MMQTQRKKEAKKEKSYSYLYQYLSPTPLPIPIPTPPSHTPKTAREARFRAWDGKTLSGVRPAQTPAVRATGATTLVQLSPSRQAFTGLPGTSHDDAMQMLRGFW